MNLVGISRFLILPLLLTPPLFSLDAWSGVRLRVGSVEVFGNKKIKASVVVREIPFEIGDDFDQEKLERAEERIRKIPGVDYVETRVAYSPRDSALAVMVIITEKPTLHGYPLIRRGYQNKLSFGIRAEESNFRGRSEQLFASLLLRGNTILEVGWENPWTGGVLHLGAGLRAFYERYRYVYDDAGAEFKDAPIRRTGAEFSLSRPLGTNGTLSLSSSFEEISSTTPGVTIKKGRDSFITLSAAFRYDSRSDLAYPWSGLAIEARGEAIAPGDEDLSIGEGSVDVRAYTSILSRNVLALQLALRFKEGKNIPIYRREHIGGSPTLRGYRYGSFNGVNALICGAEYRVPINFSQELPLGDVLLGFSFHLFTDGAASWEKDETLRSEIFHGSFGLGLLLVTKGSTGLRLDYAWNRRSSGRWEIDAGWKF